jgi:lipid A disaccharide synthetase
LFIDEPGIFEEPEYLKGKVKYVGPVLRKFEYTRKDRDRARTELGIPLDATVIGVFPGSWTEEKAPIFDLVMGAFELLEAEPKRLIS